MITRICLFCGKEFLFRNAPSDIKAGWGKFCSVECRNQSYITRITLSCLYCGKLFQTKLARAERAKYCSRNCLALYKYYVLGIRPSEKLIGTKRTEDERRRISINNAKYWLGKKRPDISRTMKGRIVSLETREKMSRRMIGKLLGDKNPARRPEVREKIRQNIKRGSDHPFWKGGVTSINDKIRKSEKYRKFSRTIKVRDNFICQICGVRSEKGNPVTMNTDHIIPFSVLIDALIMKEGINNLYGKAMTYTPLWDFNNARTLCEQCHRATETYGIKALSLRLTSTRLDVSPVLVS